MPRRQAVPHVRFIFAGYSGEYAVGCGYVLVSLRAYASACALSPFGDTVAFVALSPFGDTVAFVARIAERRYGLLAAAMCSFHCAHTPPHSKYEQIPLPEYFIPIVLNRRISG